MKKKSILFLLLGILAIVLMACAPDEVKERDAEIETIAEEKSEELSKNYIFEKYGISADFVSYELEDNYSLFYGYYNGNVACEMKFKDKTFYVLYDVDDMEHMSDNYQTSQIEHAIENFLEKECNLPKATSMEISYYEDGYMSSFYIGDGSTQVVENCINYYYDGSTEALFSILRELSVEAEYETEETLNDFVYSETFNEMSWVSFDFNNRTSNEEYYDSSYFNLKEYLEIVYRGEGEVERNYKVLDMIQKYDDFTFLYNATEDFSYSIDTKSSKRIEVEGYHAVTPIFSAVGDLTVCDGYGTIVSEIKVENYKKYYVYAYKDDFSEGTLSECSEYVEVYKDSNIVFLEKDVD